MALDDERWQAAMERKRNELGADASGTLHTYQPRGEDRFAVSAKSPYTTD